MKMDHSSLSKVKYDMTTTFLGHQEDAYNILGFWQCTLFDSKILFLSELNKEQDLKGTTAGSITLLIKQDQQAAMLGLQNF